MGFAAAWDCKPGDRVLWCGEWRVVLSVLRAGRDAPYFGLDASGVLVSWQLCGGHESA